MAKNYTCDKCGYPMEPAGSFQIQTKKYDICSACHNEIMKGLEDKGEYINTPFQQMIDHAKKLAQETRPEDYLKKPPFSKFGYAEE